ncbi:hypothetical protein NUW54_g4707 [Trametes sanguinea]|uniref:Uncharacterized protein n=1 Tax=Trametes sanguinea TaxID=158606 RepID=A0ACC1PZQ3_9APHY|nr:hypothetical protein NUW54_g4707 [Trametes sanguinea]
MVGRKSAFDVSLPKARYRRGVREFIATDTDHRPRSHRETCHSVRSLKREDAPESYAGYDTPVVLINAIKAWLEKQHDTFRFLARATVLMSCNVEQVFATPEPSRFLVIQIAPQTHPTAENWNPGNAFRFVGGSITEKTVARSVMPLSDQRWNEWMTGCRRKGERYRQSATSESSLPFMGTIPTIVIVNPFLITMLDSFHIHGLRYPAPRPHPFGPEVASRLRRYRQHVHLEGEELEVGASEELQLGGVYTLPFRELEQRQDYIMYGTGGDLGLVLQSLSRHYYSAHRTQGTLETTLPILVTKLLVFMPSDTSLRCMTNVAYMPITPSPCLR